MAGVVMGVVLVAVGLVQIAFRRPLGRWGANWRRRVSLPNVRQYAPSAESQARWSVVAGVVMIVGGVMVGVLGLSLR